MKNFIITAVVFLFFLTDTTNGSESEKILIKNATVPQTLRNRGKFSIREQTLYVANDGRPFDRLGVMALCYLVN